MAKLTGHFRFRFDEPGRLEKRASLDAMRCYPISPESLKDRSPTNFLPVPRAMEHESDARD